ncbi:MULTISPECIES: hypothetical protein [unclassified Bradyrhizobium]|nr:MULTISPECIES: hypothetical protein [unclassified Bradyrhizobium]RQH05880.1 hypothetical protein EHH60_31485 [Bradyrhizobium sp. RP6]UWU93441.1 hypothetical protein N2604_05645 [Bradyrhizobium sp. CB1015]
MLPPDAFSAAERLDLGATLESLAVLRVTDNVPAALKGDPAAAVAAALSLTPLGDVDLQVDIVMSALLHCALKDDATAALVLSHILSNAEFDHPLKIELSTLWLTHHLGRTRDPRWFAQTEVAVKQALSDEEGDA